MGRKKPTKRILFGAGEGLTHQVKLSNLDMHNLIVISKNKLNSAEGHVQYLPTLPVFPGVSKFFIKSTGLLVRAPNLPDKMDF